MTAVTVVPVEIDAGTVTLAGDLARPEHPTGIVVFAHGSGSSRMSPRNREVARVMHEHSLSTLLMDLLTPEEEASRQRARELAFDIPSLAERFLGALRWTERQEHTRGLDVGAFGASTGAAAALVAATARPEVVCAVVSRGGRPDLAGHALAAVTVPTLLLVGGEDHEVLELNRRALERIGATEKRMEVVPGAGHLFEEPGTLERVADLAASWFVDHLG